MSRLFTRDEADNLLPHIAPLLWQARELKKQHDECAAQTEALQAQAKGNGHGIDVELARACTGRAGSDGDNASSSASAMGAGQRHRPGLTTSGPSDGRVVYPAKLKKGRWWHELNTGTPHENGWTDTAGKGRPPNRTSKRSSRALMRRKPHSSSPGTAEAADFRDQATAIHQAL
jgi:hypothetical protein